jgi:hypothetical protein
MESWAEPVELWEKIGKNGSHFFELENVHLRN